MDRKAFGQLLTTLRQDLGWTQFQLAEYAGADIAVISQIERGVKKFFEPELLFQLANALQLTTWERREFFFAASGLDNVQLVRQPGIGTATDTRHPSKIIEKHLGILQQMRTLAFLNDVYGDILATNVAVLRFYHIPTAMIESARQMPGGFNTMRFTFSNELVGRTHLSDADWDNFATSSMLTYRDTTLRYRADPYFKYLMKTFRDPAKYPLFDRYWKRVSTVEQDKSMNSDLFEYSHTTYGHIKHLSMGITTTTAFGELFTATYMPLNAHTKAVFDELMSDGGDEIVRLAPWPEKPMP
jgi:transcriptional regulator with XRE-family HTH domain